ncbi:helix-turn-helix transcriptional regulator [Curtobacterium sp. L6-1]|uniref:Helix-turn-helix transcriptional regulator n=1 Tax=Curtobacterium aetherium TaxID=2841594 RepID=A0ACD1E8T1_9MICO|nr:helix-turn-helix transcriptional regulator [Curtobacterium sp. L6-1]
MRTLVLVDTHKPLAEFLRARRELLRPEDVGLQRGERRRVPGLRREEVAMLAGISSEYYLRLEQGRDQHPSDQVVDAIASALQLDEESRAHVAELARSRPERRPLRRRRPERVPDGVRMLVDTVNVPAFVMNRYRDVLAVNRLANVLEPTLIVGANRLVSLFTDEEARTSHPDWNQNTASVVAQLRADTGAEEDDPQFQALIGELSMKSERFRQLWARHDVSVTGSPSGIVHNRQVGDLTLHREKLAVVGSAGLVVVMYHAAPGTPDADKLALLSSLT